MAVGWVVVISRAIEIGGHQADRIKAVLAGAGPGRVRWPGDLAIAYQGVVAPMAPVSSDSSVIGWGANFTVDGSLAAEKQQPGAPHGARRLDHMVWIFRSSAGSRAG